MTFSKWLTAGALAVVFSTAAQAEQQSCTCVTAPAGAQASVGMVTGAEGDVMMSTREGFSPPAAGQQFGADTQFILGCEAAATIQVGNDCNLALKPGSEVSVVAWQGKVCVRADEQNVACEGGSLQSASAMHEGRSHFGLPAGIFAGTVAAGFAVSAAVGSGDRPASP